MPLETKKKKKEFDNITQTVYISWGYGNNKLQKVAARQSKNYGKTVIYMCVCVYLYL